MIAPEMFLRDERDEVAIRWVYHFVGVAVGSVATAASFLYHDRLR